MKAQGPFLTSVSLCPSFLYLLSPSIPCVILAVPIEETDQKFPFRTKSLHLQYLEAVFSI